MKSILVQAVIALGLVLAAYAVKPPQGLMRDKYGYVAPQAADLVEEDFDPMKDLDFLYMRMDRETAEKGLREARGDDFDTRGIVLEKPNIVPFGRMQRVNESVFTYDRARSFVWRTMDKHEAKWILYPYNFTYIEPPASSSSEVKEESSSTSESESSVFVWRQENMTLHEGAMLSTMSSDNFPLHTYMNWIQSKTDMDINKAKVIYDMNIAVLQIQAEREADDGKKRTVDITYDSDRFCTAFYSIMYPKYDRCFVGMENYRNWLKSFPTRADDPIFVFVSPDDILNNSLTQFGLLIIPDIQAKEMTYVKGLADKMKSKITSFVSGGGVVMTTGRSALLAENFGIVPSKTFSTRYTIQSPNLTWMYTEGCDMVGKPAPADGTEKEFTESTLCYSLPRFDDGFKLSVNNLIASPMLEGTSHGLTTLLWWKQASKGYRLVRHDENSGVDYELDNADQSRKYPALMYKGYGKGYLVVNFGNPAYSSSMFQHLYNAFLLAGERPIAIDDTLVGGFNRTVPGLEQVDLNVSVNVVNYFTTDMKNASLYVYTINGTEVKAPSACHKVTSDYPAPPSKIVVDSVYLCSVNPKQLSNTSFRFNVRIVDVLVTQQKKDVVILWPHLKYIDPNRNNMPVTVSYGVKIQAAMSALLRADMNIDPSSWYPLYASGVFVDNVLNCENKEETYALHVEQISIVPLISPLIDILDQVRLTNALVMDRRYYEEDVNHVGLWHFPFSQEGGNNRQSDYLDWDLIIDRTGDLAANWDEGVKLFRADRSKFNLPPAKGLVPREHIMNADYQTNNDDDMFLLQQFQFDDSDKFYEHAVQRLMVFLDLTIESAAATYWNGQIPENEQCASNPKVGKRRVLFVRNDLYFYKKYIMPDGFDDSFKNKFITYDRYDKNDVGDKRSVQGQFGNDVLPDGIIPAEYPNRLLYTGRTAYNLTTEDVAATTGDRVKLIHYIVPIDKRDGTKAGDFYRFDTKTGYYANYPEIKFVYAYCLDVDIAPEVSRRGGEMVFNFNEGDLPWDDIAAAAKNSMITVSADQIAVYKIYSTSNTQLRIRFKRGQMPNEAYGQPSHLRIFFENCKWVTNGDASADKQATMDLYEMHYDLSKPESGYEDWTSRTITAQPVNFYVTGAFSLPAFRLRFVIDGDLESSFMNPYELREPLVRYGLYEQEVYSHRAVYGSAEFHPKSEPSLVTRNGGFSTFTHVGTSSVPFREYVNTETSLQIPAAAETGRIEWDDIWGRHFVQNVRSTIFEYPPIPPPLRNFVMTTTFEILDKQGKRMLGGWHSAENVDVHVQMKLLNNYPKYFEITTCKKNRVDEACNLNDKRCGITRIYDTQNNFVAPEGEDDGYLFYTSGHNASYGICYAAEKAILESQLLTEEQQKGILAMTLCAKQFNTENHTCEYEYPGLPVLKRVPSTSNKTGSEWNFAQRVLDYWPENYIKENMWDLTHYDYDDNQFDKSYKYHMDNNLPHIEHMITRPDNLVAFPLFKGLGYSMVYDKTYSNKRFGSDHKGWWSDNLQNRDRTLIAGNKMVNDISVGKPSLIPESEWFDVTKFKDSDRKIKDSETNVYRCLFNRRSVKHYLSSDKIVDLHNVYENNIVPVPIDFNSTYEHHFKCTRDEWYTPLNISQYPNTVYTETPRDWLYFGANLRGGALEDINVLYQLNPLETDVIKYEGYAKVQDGGRFVYWNPANSKNSYLIVDNPVSIVLAKRNDIEILQELIPTYTTTFDSVVYHHFTISDPEEIEREWELPVWDNNYGYGDFNVQVYVGDAKTTALPEPGTTIRARITFMNNAGFDINMLKNAINSTEIGQESINAYELIQRITRALKKPEAYNFMQLHIPEELRDYVKIYPCPDVVGIAPLFFDFDSINVVTIRDGWKGDYYYNIEISKDFPEHLRGRLIEIPLELNLDYFDAFPGVGDATGVHDYTVEIPPIVFGVPYSDKNELWAGKVFYTSGYATDLDPRTNLANGYNADRAIVVSEEDLELYRKCLGRDTNPNQTTTDGEFECLDKLFEKQYKDHDKCVFDVIEKSKTNQLISFKSCMKTYAPEFPIKVPAVEGPDHAEFHILLRTNASQMKAGYPAASWSSTCSYNDWMEKPGNAPRLPDALVHAKGAWISLKWSSSLLSTSGLPLSDAQISPKNSGLAQITITLENTGDYYAYNVFFNLTLAEGIRVATEDDVETGAGVPVPAGCGVSQVKKGIVMFWCNVSTVLPPGSPKSYPFRVFYEADEREGAGYGAKSPLNMRVIGEKSTASIDLTTAAGEKRVTQDLEGPYGLKYTANSDDNLVVLSGRRSSEYGLTLTASHKLKNIRVYIWRAKLPNATTWTTFAVTNVSTVQDYVSERYAALGGDKDAEVAVDYLVAVSRDTGTITIEKSNKVAVVTQSNLYKWRVSDSNLLLLLLLLPCLAIPALIAAAVFAVRKGSNKEAVRDLGMAPRDKFVPQEMVDNEPIPMVETNTAAPPPPLPQRAAPVYEAPEPAPEAPVPGKSYAVPTGPTYLRGGVPVNVVDS